MAVFNAVAHSSNSMVGICAAGVAGDDSAFVVAKNVLSGPDTDAYSTSGEGSLELLWLILRNTSIIGHLHFATLLTMCVALARDVFVLTTPRDIRIVLFCVKFLSLEISEGLMKAATIASRIICIAAD